MQNSASGLAETPEAVILINQFSLAPQQLLNGEDSATGIIEKFPQGYFILYSVYFYQCSFFMNTGKMELSEDHLLMKSKLQSTQRHLRKSTEDFHEQETFKGNYFVLIQ